ncbi:MAG: 50S ribosomal protein L29 [Candidatus Pacebacteria bacterium]|nr:50S ribosomal protein L29 [Candidatus Paceibacterota bacterium]
MKESSFTKLAAKSQKELIKLLAEKKDSLQSFRLGNTRSKTKNVKEGRTTRKEIAQIMSIIDSAKK